MGQSGERRPSGRDAMHTRHLQSKALEKLHDHWTAHMDQLNTVSHRQLESDLPYLIETQAPKEGLPVLMQRDRSHDNEDSFMFGRSMTPVHAAWSGSTDMSIRFGEGKASYGTDSAWYSDQISKLRNGISTQQPAAPPAPAPKQIQSNEAPTPAVSITTPCTELSPPAEPSWEVIKAYVPQRYWASFCQRNTRDQPHLDLLRKQRNALLSERALRTPEHSVPQRRRNQATLTEAEKRANHIASEQKRRANIRKSYEMLCELVPALRNDNSQLVSELSEGRTSTRNEMIILEKAIREIELRLQQHHALLVRRAELQDRVIHHFAHTSR